MNETSSPSSIAEASPSRWRVCWRFARPFTLLVPAIGMTSGALVALGAHPRFVSDWVSTPLGIATDILAGALMAACMNGFSNGINQIFDVEVDRINKPHRPLPAGTMSLREAWVQSLLFLMAALGLAWSVNWQTFSLAGAAAILTYGYSAPPLRTKGRGIWANITVALPRGTLLFAAGWSSVKDVFSIEPWIIGGVFGAFFLGATTTKDFSDIEGDRAGNCRTLPVIYGIRKAIRIIVPFLVLPFLAIPIAAAAGYLSGNFWILFFLGLFLAAWGVYVARLLLTTEVGPIGSPEGSAFENHPSWKHMYLLTLAAQLGIAAAYLIL